MANEKYDRKESEGLKQLQKCKTTAKENDTKIK